MGPGDIVYDVLADLDHIAPFGYPTEQFMAYLKNDVYTTIENAKTNAQIKI